MTPSSAEGEPLPSPAPPPRPRGAIVLAVLQGALYLGAAFALRERWIGDLATLAVAALGQAIAVAALWQHRPRRLALGAALTLLALGTAWLRLGFAAAHIQTVFGPEPAEQALQPLLGSIILLPWAVAVPVHQLVHARRAPFAALFGLVSLPPLLASPAPVPDPALAVAFAGPLWAQSDTLPPLPAPGRVRVTALQAGLPVWTAGDDLATVRTTIAAHPPPDALLVEVAVAALPGGLLRPGTDAPAEPPRSPALLARALPRREVVPGVRLPATASPSLRWASAMVSGAGAAPLVEGWSPPPALSPAAIDEAVQAGVRHLVVNQLADGRYTYIVTGPSGAPGTGYNYPRAAGATWFLARAAAALDDPEAARGADLALAALSAQTRDTADGRRYIIDPSRRDGKAWIGTTALASMALATRLATVGAVAPANPVALRAQLEAQVAQLAASVAPDGRVLGEMSVRDGTFPEQVANPYGQGQVILALAVAERAGVIPGGAGTGALDRAVAWLDDGAYGTRHPLYVGDEHWTCLAAHAYAALRPDAAPAGARNICAAYVSIDRFSAPGDGAPRPSAGPAGGAAEAVVAHAWDTADSRLVDRVTAYGELFLRSQYRAADALLLARPTALVGGFRDGPGDLDVQVDAVQHIGCALLGIEAILSRRERPGSLP